MSGISRFIFRIRQSPNEFGSASFGRNRRFRTRFGASVSGCKDRFLPIKMQSCPEVLQKREIFVYLHFAFAFQEELRLRGVEVAHQRDELAHVGLLLVADVGQHGLGGRVVGCLIVGVVQEDGFKLARDVDTERLHELGVRHLAVDVACKRIGETGHTIPLFHVRRAAVIGGGSGLLSARYDTPIIRIEM